MRLTGAKTWREADRRYLDRGLLSDKSNQSQITPEEAAKFQGIRAESGEEEPVTSTQL